MSTDPPIINVDSQRLLKTYDLIDNVKDIAVILAWKKCFVLMITSIVSVQTNIEKLQEILDISRILEKKNKDTVVNRPCPL